MRITVIGGGLIGTSWCALFLAHGHDVTLFDVAPGVATRVRTELQRIAPALAELGLALDPNTPRLQLAADLNAAVRDADVVQECGPERVRFKQRLWVDIERHCAPTTLLLSSSSGIPASMQARQMRTPQRMLIAHPFNPPHLMPLVELVPGQHTQVDAVRRTKDLFDAMGKRVIVLRKEIPGFVANRIQAAVIRESVALVRQGVVSVEDLDTAMTQSLGLRWATGGPFLSAHLGGGAGGIRAFLKQFSGGLQLLWLHMKLRPVFLHGRAREELSQAVEHAFQRQSIAELASLRDRQQVAVLRALHRVEHGDGRTD